MLGLPAIGQAFPAAVAKGGHNKAGGMSRRIVDFRTTFWQKNRKYREIVILKYSNIYV